MYENARVCHFVPPGLYFADAGTLSDEKRCLNISTMEIDHEISCALDAGRAPDGNYRAKPDWRRLTQGSSIQ